MDADLDTLLIALYVELENRIIPAHRPTRRRGPGRPPALTDAELVCLAVARVLLRYYNERYWLRAARTRVGHLFPRLLTQSEYNQRLKQLAPLTEAALPVDDHHQTFGPVRLRRLRLRLRLRNLPQSLLPGHETHAHHHRRRHSHVIGSLTAIVLDCRSAPPLARFWAAALGWAVRPYDEAEVARLAASGRTPETDPAVAVDAPDGSVTLWCQEVPEPRTVKNRMHLDLRGDSPERLVSLGAAVLASYGDHAVMADPEGNEFCVYGGSAGQLGGLGAA